MKIKKLRVDDRETTSLAVERDGNWVVLRKVAEKGNKKNLLSVCDDLISFLQYRESHMEEVAGLIASAWSTSFASPGMEEVLLFQPVLYRDFMLSERHMINSARGMIRYCMPSVYPVMKIYETLTRSVFPPLKPKKAYYENPVYYKGNHLSFAKSGSDIIFPEYATLWDYELELGMIITRKLRDVDEVTALDAIGAFCVFNDFSARNVQIPEMRQTGCGPCKAKDFANAISNVAVTPDEVLPCLETIGARVIINNRIVATGRLNEFLFGFGRAVSYASKGETVYPGEFMGSGTIPGCCGLESGYLLKDGDVIRLEIDRVGYVENTVRDFTY